MKDDESRELNVWSITGLLLIGAAMVSMAVLFFVSDQLFCGWALIAGLGYVLYIIGYANAKPAPRSRP